MSSSARDPRPELIFAMVGPLGTRLRQLSDKLAQELRSFGYNPIPVRISELLPNFKADWKPIDGAGEYYRVKHLQNVANDVRRRLTDGAALARAAIIEIRRQRATETGHPDRAATGCAFIIDQLKHPAEAQLLHAVYGEAFCLVGGHASRPTREETFAQTIAESVDKFGQESSHKDRAVELVERDERSEDSYGQNIRDVYPQADVFIDLNTEHGEGAIGRFIALLFGHPFRTPTPEEYSMYLASAASLRSSDNNRQVGAAIVKIESGAVVRNADLLAVGMNEVPRAGGGFYWDGESPDRRDQMVDDRAAKIKVGILAEIVSRFRQKDMLSAAAGNGDDSAIARQLLPALEGTQLLNIGEFSRPVHAEMAAIIDAARRGVSIDGCSIYVTTFPCHNCMKHIIAAGLRRVVYLEPYAKSRPGLYKEELSLHGQPDAGKVVCCAYSGVAPRLYPKLFSMAMRGGKNGMTLLQWELAARASLKPLYVATHLQSGYAKAEREAVLKLDGADYKWDVLAICPTDAAPE